jgi:pimeloyl-ACP methyl ester carboxylesterase
MVAGRTMRSRLTHDFRLIAFDLPGHGDSRIFLV